MQRELQLQAVALTTMDGDIEEAAAIKQQNIIKEYDHNENSVDDIKDMKLTKWLGGFVIGWRKIQQDSKQAVFLLNQQNFGENPLYSEQLFERGFGFQRDIFNKLYDATPSGGNTILLTKSGAYIHWLILCSASDACHWRIGGPTRRLFSTWGINICRSNETTMQNDNPWFGNNYLKRCRKRKVKFWTE